MMKRLLLFSLLMSSITFAHAQWSARVSDHQGKPVSGARVRIEPGYLEVFTDASGRFQAAFRGCNGCTLEISKEGYETLNMSLTPAVPADTQFIMLPEARLIQSVVVTAVQANYRTPGAFTNMSKKELQALNLGQDLPMLLQWQPGVVSTSDAGAGIGYTGIRVRGSDATRINVTLNGIPLNDAESHAVFWVNTPDLVSSLSNVQLQRGVGASTNGSGAFGATLNLQTESGNSRPFAELNTGLGSFNTRRATIKAGTGLINNRWDGELRLSEISSNGYVDRASSQLGSFYAAMGYRNGKQSLRLIHFRGNERTYQAWWGVPQALIDGDRNALITHYYNNLGVLYKTAEDSVNLFRSDRRYNYYRYRGEVDRYGQSHTQAMFNTRLSRGMLSLTYHHTLGAGYFEQFRSNDAYTSYGLNAPVFGTDTITRSNLIRRRWLDNNFNGLSAVYRQQVGSWNLEAGAAGFLYDGAHFGRVIWAEKGGFPQDDYEYYHAHSRKQDANMFVRNTLEWKRFTLYSDLQYRVVEHRSSGRDNDLRDVGFSFSHGFFNPKAGFTYRFRNAAQAYASLNIGHREPNRSDFTDRKPGTPLPQPERMYDWEAGYRVYRDKWMFFGNLYFMDYQNQLVLTGAVNDVGTPLRQNVAKSHRAGMELEAARSLGRRLNIAGNLSLSRNRIQQFREYVIDYSDYSTDTILYNSTPIAFSPAAVGALILSWKPVKQLELTLNNKYVSRQFMDNTGRREASLKPYFVSDVRLAWSHKQSSLTLQVNNLLNTMYASNGYTYRYMYGGSMISENFLFPQAGMNFMLGLRIRVE
ncbi:MAG: TonB-dependent receptor [Bacteroidetes bacterium]|nr:TonB-dependent receptor [Bacteroidota bacterium]